MKIAAGMTPSAARCESERMSIRTAPRSVAARASPGESRLSFRLASASSSSTDVDLSGSTRRSSPISRAF
jgi:hypothetical protein